MALMFLIFFFLQIIMKENVWYKKKCLINLHSC